MNDTTYHIYAKDKVLYHNLKKDDFEEKWEMLNVLVGLLKTDYASEDLSFIELPSKIGYGGGSISWPDAPGEPSF